MSVFTAVVAEELACWLERYAVGRLRGFEGIAAGVQNSNFFVTTSLGRYVLTLFERSDRAELPFYLHLMAHLARHGLPVPAPIADRDNEYLGTLSARPAALVRRLSGASITTPEPGHCAAVGAMLAGLHLAGLSYRRRQDNPRGAAWRAACAQRVWEFLSLPDRALLQAELTHQAAWQTRLETLPAGTIHADLFRDNVLWEGEHIGGVIDFYFAGHDALLLDLAIAANDWCAEPAGGLAADRLIALLAAYVAERPISSAERAAWPTLLRAAALRFWLSRAEDLYLPAGGEMVLVKDPAEYRILLAMHVAGAAWPQGV